MQYEPGKRLLTNIPAMDNVSIVGVRLIGEVSELGSTKAAEGGRRLRVLRDGAPEWGRREGAGTVVRRGAPDLSPRPRRARGAHGDAGARTLAGAHRLRQLDGPQADGGPCTKTLTWARGRASSKPGSAMPRPNSPRCATRSGSAKPLRSGPALPSWRPSRPSRPTRSTRAPSPSCVIRGDGSSAPIWLERIRDGAGLE